MAPGRSMLKSQRLNSIRRRLQAGDYTSAELLRDLQLPAQMRRTLQRDLEELQEVGEVARTPEGRYTLTRQQGPPLDPVEALAVYSAARLVFHHAPERHAHYLTALEKLTRNLPEPARGVAVRANRAWSAPPDAEQSRCAELAAHAWLHRHLLRFQYPQANGAASRSVELAIYLIELGAHDHAAYAVGLERTGKPPAVQVFRIGRMRAASLLPGTYEIPTDFDPLPYLSGRWGILPGEPQRVELHFRPEAAERVSQEHLDGLAEEPLRLSTGSVRVVLQVGEPLGLVGWIRGWGPQVEVVAPAGLRRVVAEDFRAAAELYS